MKNHSEPEEINFSGTYFALGLLKHFELKKPNNKIVKINENFEF